MIVIKVNKDLSKFRKFLERIKEAFKLGIFDKYGQMGVDALSAATPVDSGVTSSSWRYEIHRSGGTVSLRFLNSNVNEGVNIAVILQYGHGTGTGGWVQGRDYINPALRPVFENMAKEIWKEVTRL